MSTRDRSLDAKRVKVNANIVKPLLVALVSSLGRKFVRHLLPAEGGWRASGIRLAHGADQAEVQAAVGPARRWSVVAFVELEDDGGPAMLDDGTGRDRWELAAAWLGCTVEDISPQ